VGKINNDISDIKNLSGNFTPAIEGYYSRLWKSYDMIIHRHSKVEIMYVLEGECRIPFQNMAAAILKKGMFIIINSNIYHGLFVDENFPCKMMNIEFAFKASGSSNLLMSQLTKAYPNIIQVFSRIGEYEIFKDTFGVSDALKTIIMAKKNDENDYYINTCMAQLFIMLGRISENENKSENNYVKNAEKFISMNYDSEIKVADIAKHLNINESYFYKIFKKAKGITPIEYLTNFRIELARNLLCNTDLSQSEICDYIGMGSRQYFSYVFKKSEGCSPTDYRKKARISFYF